MQPFLRQTCDAQWDRMPIFGSRRTLRKRKITFAIYDFYGPNCCLKTRFRAIFDNLGIFGHFDYFLAIFGYFNLNFRLSGSQILISRTTNR